MTAIDVKKANLNFAAVHDSFWVHACDTDRLNEIIRTSFINLHEQRLLETTYESFKECYPDITFPPLPNRGKLDLSKVKESKYFFA